LQLEFPDGEYGVMSEIRACAVKEWGANMPDQYLNLTPAEARALGYEDGHVRRHRPQAPQDDIETRVLIAIVTVGLIIAICIALGLNHVRPSVSTPTTQTITVERPQQPDSSASFGYPQGLSHSTPMLRQPGSVTENGSRTIPQYIPEDWDYSVARSPISLRFDRRAIGTLPAGTEFLRSFQTSNGWSFVVTLDGQTWGWAQLAPIPPRRIPLNPKFEAALTRLRALDARSPSEKGAYLPDGWTYERVTDPATTIRRDGTVYDLPVGTELLRYSRPVNGLWFVITVDGEMWGWGCAQNLPEPWPIRNGPKFEKVLARMRGLCLLRAVPSLGNAPGGVNWKLLRKTKTHSEAYSVHGWTGISEVQRKIGKLSELNRIVDPWRWTPLKENTMALFNRNDKQQAVPEIEVQGDHAVIPEAEAEEKNGKKPKKVYFDPEIWSNN
jgi:hypothetical protein